MTRTFHLAQVNIGRVLYPPEDERMAGFMGRLDDLNKLADESPGFVWRLQTESGNATALHPYADERLLMNMSVWESLAALRQYVYRSAHAPVLGQRKQWFEPLSTPIMALWWVPAGHRPDMEEAKARLEALTANGPGPNAFTFKQPFPPPTE
ncbi:MAG: DUF3291 domain-containing protein [Anaerolineales bacterium]